ncbi:MAG: bifunctional diguanylate cyclase/phosphodiesterase [Ruminiclostridium sp.]|nr:bifunctional diguanylate cyclase/phosphodiesterase [Ruminiclostridium sp.]
MNDSLTGLLQFEEFLSQAGAVICEHNKPYFILAMDVSDFHYINANLGYDIGDLVLQKIADFLTMFVPNMVYCSRSHSDHFLALIRIENPDTERILQEVQRLKERLRELVAGVASGVSPNLNIGIYFVRDEDMNIIEIVDKANIARRTNKGNYNIPCVVYSEHLMDIKESSAKVLPLFENSFRNEAIRVYLQPKISAETKKVVGAEALSRLIDSDGKVIPPVNFIAALEKTGKIVELDFYVLSFICKLIRKWIDEGIEPITISFNLSRIHFFSNTVVEDICKLAEEYNVPPQYIEIEVTESVFFEASEMIVSKVNALRDYGFKVSVDDFGTGYSSLSLIGVLPVDVVKLDKSFVKESLKSPRGSDLMKGIIKILNDIHLEIVCEGVETEEEATAVSEYGCDEMQGYLFDKPIPTDEFENKYIKA